METLMSLEFFMSFANHSQYMYAYMHTYAYIFLEPAKDLTKPAERLFLFGAFSFARWLRNQRNRGKRRSRHQQQEPPLLLVFPLLHLQQVRDDFRLSSILPAHNVC
jgi:hypothetical protein